MKTKHLISIEQPMTQLFEAFDVGAAIFHANKPAACWITFNNVDFLAFDDMVEESVAFESRLAKQQPVEIQLSVSSRSSDGTAAWEISLQKGTAIVAVKNVVTKLKSSCLDIISIPMDWPDGEKVIINVTRKSKRTDDTLVGDALLRCLQLRSTFPDSTRFCAVCGNQVGPNTLVARHLAYWDRALTDAEYKALAQGVTPTRIQPDALKYFMPGPLSICRSCALQIGVPAESPSS